MANGTIRLAPFSLALLALGVVPSLAMAQGNLFNPYGNSGYADYREYGNPSYSGNTVTPGQSRANGEAIITRPRASTYRDYIDEMESEGSGSTAKGGGSNRTYRPNDSAENKKFMERKRQRELAFEEAMKEKDPVKRSRRIRELEKEAAESSVISSKPKTPTTTKAPDPKKSATNPGISRAPNPATSTAPNPSGTRRSSPPPPLNGSSRSTTNPAPPVPGVTSRSKPVAPSRPAPDPSTIATPPPGP